MFTFRDIAITGVLAGLLAAVALALWPWARRRGRFGLGGGATLVGWCLWNIALDAAGAEGFNVDAPLIALSGQDIGSGVLAFALTVAVLAVTERHEPAGRVVGAAALAGMTAMVFDIFVL